MSAIKICSAVILHEHYSMVMLKSHSVISDGELPWRLEPLHKMALRKLLCSRLDSPTCAKSNIYHSSFQTQASFSTKDCSTKYNTRKFSNKKTSQCQSLYVSLQRCACIYTFHIRHNLLIKWSFALFFVVAYRSLVNPTSIPHFPFSSARKKKWRAKKQRNEGLMWVTKAQHLF